MRKKIPSRFELIEDRNSKKSFALLDANELKVVVRDGLATMNMADREEFIQMLESEMKRSNLHLSSYLVPLGIPGRTPEDLTPTEVGHLIRFLKINVSQAMKAVERTLSAFRVFAEVMAGGNRRLAA